ncbi:uncharacterized protein LOC126835815 [Adelges cooleyi]|uniref:uncharacterized protein LOC126835815 n=1 Tax=Adelges cooleyi TaxID=133065 RepID=UPI00217F9C68|nr:uncharacterized protein LOC126835815 [Adelges cooleyi]
MKQLFILISFALVGHVLVAKLDDYIQQVLITNDDIKQAKEFLPTIIKNMVARSDVYGMEAMAFMLAVPEKIDCVLQAPKFTYQDSDESENSDSDESVNPDSGGKIIMHFEDKLEYQKMMQSAISDVTERIGSPTVKLENLASLLGERTIHPTRTLKNRIIRSFDLTSLGSARRDMTLEAITLLIRQDDPLFQDLRMMCRLVGVFRSIKYPRTYIHIADLDEDFCILIDETFVGGHVYKFFNGEHWKVKLEDFSSVRRFSSEFQ